MRLLNKFERLSFWAHEPVAMVLKPDMSTPGQLPPLKRGSYQPRENAPFKNFRRMSIGSFLLDEVHLIFRKSEADV